MLALVPLTMIFIGASLDTIKTSAIITGVPIFLLMIVMIVGWIRWMVKDFGHIETDKIAEVCASGINETKTKI